MKTIALLTLLLLGGGAVAAPPVTQIMFMNERAIDKDAPPLFARATSGRQPLLALVNIQSVEPVEGVAPPCGNAPGTLCMSAWFRYKLKIKQVLVGDEPRKAVLALRIAHALPIVRDDGGYSPDVLAILAPDESDDHARPEADYRLKQLIWPSYCVNDALSAYGLKSSKGDGAGCHSAGTIRRTSDRDDE